MIRMLMAAFALMLAVPAMAQELPRKEIEAAMLDSAEGWNKGEIDRFLALYSDDPATSFTGSKGTERGKAGIKARYIVKYTGQFGPARKDPSALSFAFDDLRWLGKDHVLLIARWTLTTPGKAEPDTGMTSLVFRKEAGGWKIVADHSS